MKNNTYIALLRGINVSGKHKVKMAALKALVETLGCTDVSTYIQSGNILFKNTISDTQQLQYLLEEGMKTHFGFEIPILIFTSEELNTIVHHNEFLKKEEIDCTKLHYTFVSEPLNIKMLKSLEDYKSDSEKMQGLVRTIYLYLPNGYGRTKLTNTFFEKKLKCSATTRNYKTINTLMTMCRAL